MLERFDDSICAVCARRACGAGYSDWGRGKKPPILWLCDDPDCIQIAKETYNMKQDEFSRIESLSAGKIWRN